MDFLLEWRHLVVTGSEGLKLLEKGLLPRFAILSFGE